MSRFGYVMTTYVVVLAIGVLSFVHVAPKLIWNASASAPLGLYRIESGHNAPLGALVAVAPPERLARWMAERRYLGLDAPLLKHVAAKAGQRICRIGAVVSVEDRPVAVARERDRLGRPLPVWRGCRTLAAGELLLINPAVPDSLDGRYFGPLPASALIGRAIPILTRDAPGSPLVWRGL
jgi:conjugative transfer signal peptidase TraF